MKKIKKQNIQYLTYLAITTLICLYILYVSPASSFYFIAIGLALAIFLVVTLLFTHTKDINYQKTQIGTSLAIVFIAIFSLQSIFAEEPDSYIGIDVSHWNGELPYESISSQIDFVIISCGYTSNVDGTTKKVDPNFEYNIAECKAQGIPYGVYYYSLATTPEAAQEEAEYVLSLLEEAPPLGVYIDIEDEAYQGHLSESELTEVALGFVEKIEENYYEAGVYANHYWWNNKLDASALENHFKWIANYNEDYQMEDAYHMHQYTDTGILEDSNELYDLNIVKEKFW